MQLPLFASKEDPATNEVPTLLNQSPEQLRTMLSDESVPLNHRVQMLGHICMEGGELGQKLFESFLKDSKTPQTAKSVHAKKTKELTDLINQMNEGPLRSGTFMRMMNGKGKVKRAHILLDDGSGAFVVLPDAKLAKTLRRGDTVALEGQGKAVLFRDDTLLRVGEEARFERRLDDARVEVSVRDGESRVVHVSAELMDQIEAGRVTPGRQLLVCMRRSLAFDAIPELDGFAHFRFLSRDPVPDVRIGRDLAAPPPFIEDLVSIARLQMLRPDLCVRFGLRSCVMKLLSGVSGSGKTFSLLALERELYELMSEVTGAPVSDLPPRVLRMRTSDILSKWLGEAEQNLERFFEEAETLAAETFLAPDGTTHKLPVLVVMEEIDGLGRARGGGEPILDRILTTVLRRLDTSRPDLRDKLILFVGTTNVASQVDPAFLRRVGGTVEQFGRLSRADFVAMLRTHLQGRPLESAADADIDVILEEILAGVTGWIFGEKESDPGQVELQFAGATTPDRKYRRDFLTASVIDRAVQDAAWRACRSSYAGDQLGMSLHQLLDAFDRQIGSIVDQLRPTNASDYLDVPDGVRVATVRRVPQSVLPPHNLERVA